MNSFLKARTNYIFSEKKTKTNREKKLAGWMPLTINQSAKKKKKKRRRKKKWKALINSTIHNLNYKYHRQENFTLIHLASKCLKHKNLFVATSQEIQSVPCSSCSGAATYTVVLFTGSEHCNVSTYHWTKNINITTNSWSIPATKITFNIKQCSVISHSKLENTFIFYLLNTFFNDLEQRSGHKTWY